MKRKFPAEALDAELQRSNAESKRRAEFAALFEKGAAGVKDGKLDMDTIRWFLGDVTDRLDAGVVYNYDSPIWDTIGKVLSFDMEYFFSYVDRPEGREPDLERDLCGETGWLGEEKDQQEIHAALKRFLISAGALAQRIGSSTYDGWRQLLVEREFCKRKGTNYFESEKKFIPFRDKCAELNKLLWADNEIFRRNSITHTAPHTTKKSPQKRGV